jgi:uridine kinase
MNAKTRDHWDLLICVLVNRKRAEIPVYSFEKHARLSETTSIYSPHVLILEGIFALYDPRVLDLIDMGVCYHGAFQAQNVPD